MLLNVIGKKAHTNKTSFAKVKHVTCLIDWTKNVLRHVLFHVKLHLCLVLLDFNL